MAVLTWQRGVLAVAILAASSAVSMGVASRGSPCTSPGNRPGSCIPMLGCDPLTALFKTKPSPDDIIDEYMNTTETQCEWEDDRVRLVCCPNGPKYEHRNMRLLPTDMCGTYDPGRAVHPWLALLADCNGNTAH
ncbi:uncharacterized protein LOC117647828 [Thrips palmi]|uniref:Uncharacterized protein LOC117647828 n=1 Tax=Thrips palmi TaxID=161013 RepID=A0A6P8Z685_THRPL|nr:uncharacterized protein LOC117647828 [Thrips palmi]